MGWFQLLRWLAFASGVGDSFFSVRGEQMLWRRGTPRFHTPTGSAGPPLPSKLLYNESVCMDALKATHLEVFPRRSSIPPAGRRAAFADCRQSAFLRWRLYDSPALWVYELTRLRWDAIRPVGSRLGKRATVRSAGSVV